MTTHARRSMSQCTVVQSDRNKNLCIVGQAHLALDNLDIIILYIHWKHGFKNKGCIFEASRYCMI
jgi:hypothetical protein